MSEDKDKMMVEDLALNPNTPIEDLKFLGTEYIDYNVRKNVASNPSLTEEVIRDIYRAEDARKSNAIGVFLELALNPNCPADLLAEIIYTVRLNSYSFYKEDLDKLSMIADKVSIELEKDTCPPKLIKDSMDLFYYNKLVADDASKSYGKKVYKKIEALSKKAKKKNAQIKKEKSNNPLVKKIVDYKKTKIDVDEKKIELKQKEEYENRRKEVIEDRRKRLLKLLGEIKELSENIAVNEYRDINNIDYSSKTQIPESVLLITVGEHKEINPEYIPYLPYIDLSYVDTTNLKVSGIDWSNTNISIDPQKVFMKDLSYSKFSDENIVFKSFDECNLSGTDISDEKDSTITENIIVDDNTKLPETNKRAV